MHVYKRWVVKTIQKMFLISILLNIILKEAE